MQSNTRAREIEVSRTGLIEIVPFGPKGQK